MTTHYKPYTPEWHRKRYLKEALDKYIDDYVDDEIIVSDILDILYSRSEEAQREFEKTNKLAWMFAQNTK